MKKISSVCKLQIALFLKDQGMIAFYLISILVIGILLPLFIKSSQPVFTFSLVFTISFAKPLLADSFTGEREKKTLESLLSTNIRGSDIVWGKVIFCLLFSLIYFIICICAAQLVNIITGVGMNIKLWQWATILILFFSSFFSISLAGVFLSATSDTSHTANSKITKISYPIGILLIAYFSILTTTSKLPALIIGTILFLINMIIIIIFKIKISSLKQSNYFENVKLKVNKINKNNISKYSTPKSEFKIVLTHEIKYFLKYKAVLRDFTILCFCPALFLFTMWLINHEINIYYAVFLIILMIPRTPTNLIALSIGGEKAYKTGESLLSTPLKTSSIFLGKCMVAIIVSIIMLIVSSMFTLICANFISYFTNNGVYLFTLDQLVLIFLTSILSCITMVFFTGILSMVAKTPRNGLYISSLLGTVFTLPPILIVYNTTNPLRWSLLYCLVLLIINVIFILRISNNITRPKLMNKL